MLCVNISSSEQFFFKFFYFKKKKKMTEIETTTVSEDDCQPFSVRVDLHSIFDEITKWMLLSKPKTRRDIWHTMYASTAAAYQREVELGCHEWEEEEENDDEEALKLLCGLTVGRVIGSGANGDVYKALDSYGTVYAVKVMITSDPSEVAMEYEILKRLSHRNIVGVWNYCYCKTTRRSEIVMSYWTEGSIASHITEFGTLSLCTVQNYAYQLLQGLSYLHSCNVIHRDIKPQNMLVDTMGCVALTDFGLSSVSNAVDKSNKDLLEIVGSPPYLSPEIITTGKYSIQSDIWAFGCSLLDMLTAKICWSGDPYETAQFRTSWTIQRFINEISEAAESGASPLDKLNLSAYADDDDIVGFLKMCFSRDNVTASSLGLHSFVGASIAADERICFDKGIPFIKYSKVIPLSGETSIYLSAKNSLLPSNERNSFVEMLFESALSQASGFSFLDIKRKSSDLKYNNTSTTKSMMYPTRKRPAHTLLSLLGRTLDREDVEPGLPHVELFPELLRRNDDSTQITINAEVIDKVSLEEKNSISPDDLLDTSDSDGPSAADIYGSSSFSITVGELKRLTRSTYVATTQEIPETFFRQLVAFTSPREYQLFWSAHRSVSLVGIGQKDVEERLREETLDELNTAIDNIAKYENLETQSAKFELMKWKYRMSKAQECLDKTGILFETTGYGSSRWVPSRDGPPGRVKRKYTVFNNGAMQCSELLDRFDAWRKHIVLFPYDSGFPSAADAMAALNKSLTEICTAVCVSQQGFFLVDGADGNHNQLTAATPQPVTFLHAAGLDFSKPGTTAREASKYFKEESDSEGGTTVRGFQPFSQFRLKERIKDLYRTIFTCARHHAVRNMSMLAMGCGCFLANIHDEDKEEVREAYFLAQFELLSEVDWGFEGYYLNPGPPHQRATAIRVLEKLLGGSGLAAASTYLKCNVIFHSCDAKFLAAELAKRCMGAAMLSPSDCASVVLGLVGTYWETGRGSHYSGEEDLLAHTTGILARAGIAEFWEGAE